MWRFAIVKTDIFYLIITVTSIITDKCKKHKIQDRGMYTHNFNLNIFLQVLIVVNKNKCEYFEITAK